MTTRHADQPFPKVALDVLDDNQDALRAELIDGFGNRRDIVEWWQRAAVMTFGNIEGEWPASSLIQDRTLLNHLVGRDDVSWAVRRKHRENWLEPACNDAYNHLKTAAVERLPEDDDDPLAEISVSAIDDPAMRPAFSVLDTRQHTCLRSLWGGFESREQLSSWLATLNGATFGEINREFAGQLTRDRVAVRYLLERETQVAAVYRVKLAIKELLPAFATAAKRLQGGEATPREEAEPSPFEDRG